MTSRIVPASIRNNNPGAMYPGRSSRKYGALAEERLTSRDGVHRIATFPTPIHGGAALFELLATAYVNRTLEAAIRKWSGGFHVASYLRVMRDRADMQPTEYITPEKVRDPAWAIRFARAMAWHEAGREYPMNADDWAEAHAMFLADGKAPEPSGDNDVPTKRHEQRTAETVQAVVKTCVPPVVIGGGALVAAPPEVVTQTIENASAWQAISGQAIGLASWAVGKPLELALVVALVIGLGWLLPAWARRQG